MDVRVPSFLAVDWFWLPSSGREVSPFGPLRMGCAGSELYDEGKAMDFVLAVVVVDPRCWTLGLHIVPIAIKSSGSRPRADTPGIQSF